MSKFSTVFTDKEGFILGALWEDPQGHHSTYSLIGSQGVVANAPEFDKEFGPMQEAVERLYELGLLRGDRLKDAAGRIYFGDLELTTKGEQETIRYRKDQAKLRQELAKVVEEAKREETQGKES